MNGKEFFTNWMAAVTAGMIIGLVGVAAEGFHYFKATIATKVELYIFISQKWLKE